MSPATSSPPTLTCVPVTTPEQLATVAALAHDIWYEFYVPLIGRAQVDYMVAKFQNVEAMRAQIAEGYEYFLVRREDADGDAAESPTGDAPADADTMKSPTGDIGYIAVQEQPERVMFLSKFYLQHAARGSGTGRRCMEFIERLARRRGLTLLWLTVNKGNPSVQAYQRLGFRIAAELVMDIGGGFVMDDFRMEKPLAAVAVPGLHHRT